MSEQALRVLLVDDEESLRDPLAKYLRGEPYKYTVEAVPNGIEALRLLEETQGRYDVALIDEVLEEGPGGLELLKQIKARHPDIEVILFTGWGLKSGEEARHAGAYSYLAKPFDRDQLALTIYDAAERKRIRREHEYMAALVKTSRELTQVTRQEEQLALVWDFVRKQLATSTFFISLYDSETDILHFPLAYDEGEPVSLPDVQLGLDQANWGLAGYTVKTGQEQVWFTREQAEGIWQSLRLKPRRSPKGPSQSGICLPLQVFDKILGTLSVQSYQPHAFDAALLDSVRTLGNQASIALENSRLFARAEQEARDAELQANKLKALQNLAVAIRSSLELPEILNWTCKAAVELSGADHSGLVVFDEDQSKGTVVAEYPSEEKAEITRTLDTVIEVRGVPIEEQLVFEKRIINVADLAQETKFGPVREILLSLGIRSIMIVPVILNGKVVASFSLDSTRERAFKPFEVEICQMLAEQAAVAIGNSRLFDAEAKRRQEAETLREAALALIADLNPDKVIARILGELRKVVPYDSASVQLLKGNRLEIIDGEGFPNLDELKGHSFPVNGENPNREVWLKKAPVIALDAPAVYPDFLKEPHVHAHIRGWLGVPMLVGDRFIGMIALDKHESRFYTEDHAKLALAFATQAAIAIEHARRMRVLEHLRDAIAKMASVAGIREVLQQIVKSAREVLGADCALIWSYDETRDRFFPGELVAEGIPLEMLEEFKEEEPEPGRTTRQVLEKGYIPVTDFNTPKSDFIGPRTRESLNALGVISFEGIRLRVGSDTLGVLFADYKHLRTFPKEDKDILENFANHAALALKKARLLDQVQKARNAAAVVADIVALGKDVETTWNTIVAGAKDALDCDAVTLYRYNEDGKELEYPPAMIGVKFPDRVTLLPTVQKDSIVWKVLESNDLVLIEDAPVNPLTANRRFTVEEGISSLVGIPLKATSRKVGVMFVNYHNRHRFTDDELMNVRLFSSQAAVAIVNAQLHDETRKRADVLEGLYKAGKAVTDIPTLNEILERIAEQAWHLIDQPAGYTSIRLVENEIATVVAAYPPEELAQSVATFPKIDLRTGVGGRFGVTGRAIKTRTSQLVDDVSSDNDYLPSHLETRSELAVPIQLGERVIGAINAESPELRAFGKDDERTLELLATHAAAAINNARLYDQTKKRAEALEGLHKAGNAITSTLAVNEVLAQIAEQALHIVSANPKEGCFSHVALLEENKLRFIAGFPLEILGDLRHSVGVIDLQKDAKKGIVGRAVRTGQTQNVLEVSSDPYWIPLRENTHSQLSAPLKIGERIIGVLSIEHPKPAAFSEEDVHNIELLAAQAAVAIENAQLFEERVKELSEQEALVELSQKLLGTVTLQEVLDRAVAVAADVLGTDFCDIVLPDKDGTLIMSAGVGWKRDFVGNLRLDSGTGSQSGHTIMTKSPAVVNDYAVEKRFTVPPIISEHGIKSGMSVPIFRAGEVIGAMLVHTKTPRHFNEAEANLLSLIANQTAIAIRSAEHQAKLLDVQEQLSAQTALDWMLIAGSTWGHGVTTAAIVIKENAQSVRSLIAGSDLAEKLGEKLQRVEEQAQEILNTRITVPLSAEVGVELVRVNTFLHERVLRICEQRGKDVGIEWSLKLQDTAGIRVSPEWFRRALDILVDNAIEAMVECPTKLLTISSEVKGKIIEIAVSDSGKGIPEEKRRKLFRESIPGGKGMGLGLMLASKIVRTYGGHIRLGSSGPTGTTVIISLPVGY